MKTKKEIEQRIFELDNMQIDFAKSGNGHMVDVINFSIKELHWVLGSETRDV
jgi:hypothetical protein